MRGRLAGEGFWDGRLVGGLEGRRGGALGEGSEDGLKVVAKCDKLVLLGVTVIGVLMGNAPLVSALAVLLPAVQAWKCVSHQALRGWYSSSVYTQ